MECNIHKKILTAPEFINLLTKGSLSADSEIWKMEFLLRSIAVIHQHKDIQVIRISQDIGHAIKIGSVGLLIPSTPPDTVVLFFPSLQTGIEMFQL